MSSALPKQTANGRWVRRVKLWELIDKGVPRDGKPWVHDWRSYDIDNTVANGIRNTPDGCVAVSLSMLGGKKMIVAAERAARERGIRVLWWFGPSIDDLSDEVKQRMRGWVREAREALS